MSFLDKILDDATVEWKPLGEVANLSRGRVMSKEYLIDNAGEYPVYSSQTVNNGEIGKINSYDFVELYLEYLKSSDEVKQKLISDIDEESKDLFYKYSENLEHLHKYNRHKYIGKSPAVHLDVFNSEVPDGWINYKSYSDDFLKRK